MKRLFTMVIAASVMCMMLMACGASRKGGVGCPGNPMYNYKR